MRQRIASIGFLLLFLAPYTAQVHAAERVTYCEDSIFQIEDDVISLLGGSKWETIGFGFFLSFQDALIISGSAIVDGEPFQYNELLSDGNRSLVIPVSGTCVSSTGKRATVVREEEDGEKLTLDDGTVLRFSSYDSFDTGFWLPPYEVLITGDGLYMWNLDDGKKVWVQSIQ